jgi:hypothetical protein
LLNEELHILYSSPDIIRQIKSRRMRWAGHVARMGGDRKVWGREGELRAVNDNSLHLKINKRLLLYKVVIY